MLQLSQPLARVDADSQIVDHGRFITFRAITIACALMPLMALWTVQCEMVWYSAPVTAISLFIHVTFVLFLLSLANVWIRRRWPQWALSPMELMTIYVMLSIAGTLCSLDLLQILIPMIAYPIHAASPENQWGKSILPYLSQWAILTDKNAAQALAVGNSSLYHWDILRAWCKPICFWLCFVLALYGALMCISAFFRQPWTEKEHLSFPIIQIPLMITRDLPSLLRNRLFWLAFCLAGGIDLLNGFQHFFPNLPRVPIVDVFWFNKYFLQRPWNIFTETRISLYPFVIGLSFFLPLDLAFSCWFFFIFYKVQLILTNALGIYDIPGFPFIREQAGGGYLSIGLLAVWMARRHFVGAGRSILGLRGGLDESREALRYRTMLIIFILCLTYLIVAGTSLSVFASHAATVADGTQFSLLATIGKSVPLMLLFFLIFFLYSLAIARIRAELGPPAHDLHFRGPEFLIHDMMGDKAIGKDNIATFSLFYWFNRAYRAHICAHSIEGYKIASIMKIQARRMMGAMTIAIGVGALSAFWAILHILYVHGYAGRYTGDPFSSEAWHRMSAWTTLPNKPNIPAVLATGASIIFTLFLGFMRMRFTWWPWHPVGYAVTATWSMEQVWACIFIAWLVKLVIVRYGGAQGNRKALPFFVGLVLGEFTIGGFWLIYGAIAQVSVYHFWASL